MAGMHAMNINARKCVLGIHYGLVFLITILSEAMNQRGQSCPFGLDTHPYSNPSQASQIHIQVTS